MYLGGLLSILCWIPAWLIKFVIFDGMGLVACFFVDASHPIWGNKEDPVPRPWYKPHWSPFWRDYGWRALRNRSNGLRDFFTEPEVKHRIGTKDEPEQAVRAGECDSAWRWQRTGLRSEYWRVWKSKGEIAEIRLGWKWSGVPGFMVTAQVRRGK